MDHVHLSVGLIRIKHNADRKQHCCCFSLCNFIMSVICICYVLFKVDVTAAAIYAMET